MTEKDPKPLPAIWHVPDELWVKVKPILGWYDPPKRRGRKRIDPRRALDAIILRLRTGCQWNRLSKEFPEESIKKPGHLASKVSDAASMLAARPRS